MKGCPSLIESTMDPHRMIHALVLEKLGPSLEDLCNLKSPQVRFDEKMSLALAIQMVRDFLPPPLFTSCTYFTFFCFFNKLDRYAELHARKIIHNGAKPANICIASLSSNATDASTLYLIDFGFSFFGENTRLDRGIEFSGNKRFWSALSYHAFSAFLFSFSLHFLPFINAENSIIIIAQSQRDDLESLGYLLSALFQGSLPWDDMDSSDTWRKKMSTPGSTLFRDMDPSFLEYWKDVRSLAFNEVPDYCSLRSRFVKCWERKGFDSSPGEYDWLALFNKLNQEKTTVLLDNPSETSLVSEAPSVIASCRSAH